jgi:predicted MPP superfamily phosphohydrolase
MISREDWQKRRALLETQPGRISVTGPRRAPVLRSVLRVGRVISRISGISRLTQGPARRISVSERSLSCPGLPVALDGFSILHLSDPHLEATPALVEPAADLLSRLEADIAVVTGDFQIGEHHVSDPLRAAALMRPLIEAMRVRQGKFAILGNHDSYRVVEPLEAAGLTLLINEHTTIAVGGAQLHLVGLDDLHTFYTEHARQALHDAPEGFRIMLAHTPELADVAAKAGYGLYLSGHTHGGQICLPGGRPLVTGLDTHRHLASGHWRIGSMHGYTNRGLGIGGMPIRINCPAEIALLRLRSVPD